jgi:hypothetical protein
MTADRVGNIEFGATAMRANQLAVGLAVIIGVFSGRVGEAAIRVVAYAGQQAPGMPAGVEFDEIGQAFSTPRIDGQGRVVFAGATRNPNLTLGPGGIWTERSGALAAVVRQNDPAPGTSSTFTGVSLTTALAVNKSGHTVFRSGLSGGNFGYFTDRTGTLTNIASEGLMTSFGPLTSFDGSEPMLVDDSGRTTFVAYVDAETGILLKEVTGGPGIVAVEGMDTLEDHRFKIVTGSPFDLNAMTGQGYVLGKTSLEGKNNNTMYTQGLYRDSSGVYAAIQLNLTPGPGEAANYASFDDPAMNNAGQTVFEATLSGPSVTDATNHGIWYLTTGAPTRLMRDGTQAPGEAAGVNFSNALGEVNAAPVINGAGKVLFHYGLTGPGVTTANDLGLWAGTPGNLTKVVREGDPAPGLGAGATFTSILSSGRAINAAGQVAFYAFFNAPGGAGAGLFAQNSAGVIQLIARTGQTIQIAPGDVRTIETLEIFTPPTGNQDGRATFFNDQGYLAFRATFTDGEETDAILVSDGVANPYRQADFQEDHDVDNNDLAQWRANFGLATGATHTQGNADFDGDVDGHDFLTWQQQRGSGPLAASNADVVPEPGALLLAALGLSCGHWLRRRESRA